MADFLKILRLGFCRCANRANACAGAAVDAGIRINDHVVAFSNSANRAIANACAACNTSIFINNVCHNILQYGLFFFSVYYYKTIYRIGNKFIIFLKLFLLEYKLRPTIKKIQNITNFLQ